MSTSGGDLPKLSRVLRSFTDMPSLEKPNDLQKVSEECKGLQSTQELELSKLIKPREIPIHGAPLPPSKRARYEAAVCLPSDTFSEPLEFPLKTPKLSSNARKIQNLLCRACELSDSDEDERKADHETSEKNTHQQIATASESYFGVRRSDILGIRKYAIVPEKLPKISTSFESFRAEQLSALLARVRPSVVNKVTTTAAKKITASKEYPKFPTQSRPRTANKNVTEKMETLMIKKAWSFIIKKDIPKAFRGMQKLRSDIRNNGKRLAQLCSKEILKKANKMNREAKEANTRAKRLQREMVSYWKRRERETADMRRKREREETEARKKREEEEEAERQRKRLEWIMRQSDIYSHFMAQKLGIAPPQTHTSSMAPQEEEKVQESVKSMIKDHRDHLTKFGDTVDNEDLKDIGLTGLDRVDENKIFSRIETPPPNFKGELKEYQLKGLRWLDNLYDQGINGILADEMGLGKTIQTIALMAHLAHSKNLWGPFLIVCPSSTLHNWQNELEKFCPTLKVLAYWGQMKERKTLRRYMQNRKLGREDSPFHVCITSYQLIISDEKAFQKVMWRYMILDEAHAIKNTSTQRWNVLLKFNSRNKLLLTGTPIQNSMAELWALLHFIMPNLFDSHEHFQEWFSKDIEAHSQDSGALNQHQLQRLHAILKPFMLRRIKKDVESEIGRKTEIEIFSELTVRQKVLYERIKSKVNIGDLFLMAESKANVENLMNLIMQLRKVCNHPDLFERRPEKTPVTFLDPLLQDVQPKSGFNQMPIVRIGNRNPIRYNIPRLVYQLYLETKKLPSVYGPEYFWLFRSLGLSYNEGLKLLQGDDITKGLLVLHYQLRYKRLLSYQEWNPPLFLRQSKKLHLHIAKTVPILENQISQRAVAAPIDLECSSIHFHNNVLGAFVSPVLKKLVLGNKFKPSKSYQAEGQRALQYCLEEPAFVMASNVDLPTVEKLLHDSAKLKALDNLLVDLYSAGHRILIFCQMTRMLDILEDYLYFRNFSFLRMDGSTNISDRRDMIEEFQKNEEIFAFILSTRAGGLGVNLTAADTVIFYDIDWNPTMDAQATDRVHRIGQSKPVEVYRLICSNTVEERILKRAKQKQTVQSTVYAGGAFKGDIFKPSEVMELLLDEKEYDSVQQTQKFMGTAKRGKKKKEKEGIDVSEIVNQELS